MTGTRHSTRAAAIAGLIALIAIGGCSRTDPDGLAFLERAGDYESEAVVSAVGDRDEMRVDAMIIVRDGQLLYREGQVAAKINTHSVRKSVVAILYGIAVERGLISLDQTLEEIGFDDTGSPLTEIERQATIRDLMTARSGIYIEASGQNWDRPQRYSAQPGEEFFYNNWGFNALGEILEQKTGQPLGALIDEWLGTPLDLQHFSPADVDYDSVEGSSMRQYVIYMSADDLMRIGLLVANGGEFQGERIVSQDWITEMTAMHSSAETDPPEMFNNGFFDGYGYLWWGKQQAGSMLIAADGWGGQILVIDPQRDIVIVSRRNTGTHLLAQGWFLWRGNESDRPEVYAVLDRLPAPPVTAAID